MKVEVIKVRAGVYNLHVDDRLMIEEDSYNMCDQVRIALEEPSSGYPCGEAREIAASIMKSCNAQPAWLRS